MLGTLIAAKFGTSGVAEISRPYAIGVVFCICVFVSAFAWSWGPLGWLVPSEIFPLEIRSAAQSAVVVFNMTFTFVIAQVFLVLLCRLKFGLFYFFGAWEVAMTLFVYFFLPETKGSPSRRWTPSGASTGTGSDSSSVAAAARTTRSR